MRSWLWLLLLGLAVPARAEYRRWGLLQWAYDDVTIKAPNGRRRSSSWNQSYQYGVEGPLASTLIGEGQASVNFMQGKSLAQSVANNDAQQRILGYSFSANLLPPGLRRFVTLAPSFSRTKTSQVWGEPPVPRDLIDTSRGLSLGLALPRLPSFSVSRSEVRRTDASAAPLVDQKTVSQSEQAVYTKGPLRAQYRHDSSRVEDRLSPASGNRTSLTSGDLELNLSDLRGRGLQRVFARTTYQGQELEVLSAVTREKSYAASLFLSSQHLRRGAWDSYLGYASEYGHSTAVARDLARNSLTLTTSGPLTRGRLDNQLSWTRADGRSRQESLSEAGTAEWRSSSGKTTMRLNGNGGWAWDPASGASLSDSLRDRVSVAPIPLYDVYAEAGTGGATPLGGRDGGSRQHNAGAGLGVHAAPYADLAMNYSISRARSFPTGLVSVNQSLTAQAQAAPLERVRASLSYSVNWSRTSEAESSRNALLGLTLGYAAFEGLDLSGELTHSGKALNAAAISSYSVGKTRLAVRFERQELYTITSYSRVNVTLSRAL